MKPSSPFAALLLVAACFTTPRAGPLSARVAPLVDYHQHLVSPAFEPIVKLPRRDGAALVRELDAAGIERAVVLSVGYSFADERKGLTDPDRLTREENDWTSGEVVKNARRLIGFCGANPLRPAALQELGRCLGLPGMIGIKLHFGNAGITLRDPAHLVRIQQVFALAQRLRAPVLVHMRARGGTNYGAEDAQIFLDKVVPMARDIEIVVAHLGASSPGYPPQNDEVMGVFAAATERKDPRMANLYFDVAANVTTEMTPAEAALVAQRIRQVGTRRVLYGSDLSAPGGSIGKGWEIFRTTIPLTAAEMQQIANNRTSFVRYNIPVVRLRAEPYSFEYNSGLSSAARLVVRDAGVWQSLWTQIYQQRFPVPARPAIDFSREMVVVVALGTRSSGGYSILIDGASGEGANVAIAVRSIAPGQKCGVTAALTQPVDIARMPRRDGKVSFAEHAEVKECN